MLKIRNTTISNLFIITSLLIAVVFLAACATEADAAAAAPGLHVMAGDKSSESTAIDTAETTTPAKDEADSVVDAPDEDQPEVSNSGNGQKRIAERSQRVYDPEVAPELRQEEMDSLAYMREEEKLARDVYLALYAEWGVPVFQNIAGSEQAHMDSILMLLEQYGLADPAAGLDAGEFTNPLFQGLFQELVAQGNLSLADALTAGATIEELDIVDLQERLVQTENGAIVQVYSNLLAGSENHLRAFVSNLERQSGETYQPVYLDLDAYQAIMNGSAGQGNGQGGNGNGNRSSGGGNGRGNGRNGNA